MKRQSIKPQIYSEEFVVSETISTTSDCRVKNFNHYSGGCAYKDSNYTFFYSDACENGDDDTYVRIDKGDEGSFEDFCTNGPVNAVVFNS